MKKTAFVTRIAAITGIALGSFALAAIAAPWTAPTAPPPGNNVAAPINVGYGTPIINKSTLQEKTDSLAIDGGLMVLGNLVIATGTPVAGATLTAIDTTGAVKWTAPGAAPTECGNDGFMYSRVNTNMDDWDTLNPGDSLEFYCRNHIVRICLSGDSTCAWRKDIASDDADTCNFSAGALTGGIGTNTWHEWKAAPPSLCPADGGGKCTNDYNFNKNATVMAYALGSNTWYTCSANHQKGILSSY